MSDIKKENAEELEDKYGFNSNDIIEYIKSSVK